MGKTTASFLPGVRRPRNSSFRRIPSSLLRLDSLCLRFRAVPPSTASFADLSRTNDALYSFGCGEADCEVIRWWDEAKPMKIRGPEHKALVLKRPLKALTMVSDYAALCSCGSDSAGSRVPGRPLTRVQPSKAFSFLHRVEELTSSILAACVRFPFVALNTAWMWSRSTCARLRRAVRGVRPLGPRVRVADRGRSPGDEASGPSMRTS